MKSSPFLSLNKHDLLKGLLMSVLTPVFFIIEETVKMGSLTFNWQTIGMAAIGGFCAYLTKNLFTPAEKPKAEEPKA